MNDTPPPSSSDTSEEHALTEAAIIASALDVCYSQLGRQFGPLSRPQRRMLRLLSVDVSIRVGDLGEQLGLTTAGTTRMLDKLESLGFAARSRKDQHDQRQVYVRMTPVGASALREAEGVFLERMHTLLQRLSPIERTTLARLLQMLSER